MRLFHFSDDPRIEVFEPRPPRVLAVRPSGQQWLNGPLVWAIDEPHSILYLFPRECPRVVIWPTRQTTDADRLKWLGPTSARAIAYIEAGWLDRVRAGPIHTYEMPLDSFEDTGDAGMWVSRSAARPVRMETLTALDRHLASADVELRILDHSYLAEAGLGFEPSCQWYPPSKCGELGLMSLSRIRILLEPLIRRVFHLYWRFARGMTLGVRVLVLDGEGRVFLVKHSYVAGWHLPGGGVEVGETALDAMRRELEEEGNITFDGEPRLHGLFFNRHVSRRDHVVVYIVRSFHQASKPRPNREIVDCGFFDVNALPEGTTRGTRRRIREAIGEDAISLDWV